MYDLSEKQVVDVYFNPDWLYCVIDLLYSFVRSIYKPPRRLISTEYMDQDKVSCNLRTAVTKELIEYNPTVADILTARIVRNSTHRDGAIYNNTRLQEDFVEGDLADRNESKCFKWPNLFSHF
jgi:hypothetical protein